MLHIVDYPCDIIWSGVSGRGGGLDHAGRQDGGISSIEGVGIGAGEIVSVAGCQRGEDQGPSRVRHVECGDTIRKMDQSYSISSQDQRYADKVVLNF